MAALSGFTCVLFLIDRVESETRQKEEWEFQTPGSMEAKGIERPLMKI